MEIDKEQLKHDFEELLTVPQLKQALYHRVKEMKMYNQNLLDKLNLIKSKINTKPVKPFKGENGQPFQLYRIKKKWVPSVDGIDDRIPYDVIPEAIINQIVKDNIGPGEIRMKRTIESEGTKASVSYEKIEDTVFSGILYETVKEESPTPTVDYHQMDNERLQKIEEIIDYLLQDRESLEYIYKEIKFRENLKNQAI